MAKVCLTSEFVDSIASPQRGEVWIGDNHVPHFGLRVWAGRGAGGKAFAIRLRDQFGVVVREAYRPDRDFPLYNWYEGWEKPLGYFLDHARKWAVDRVAVHRGNPTSADLRERRWLQRRNKILATKIGDAIDRKLIRLKRKSHDHLYVDHIRNMVDQNVTETVRASTFRDVPIRELADSISHRTISYGNVKVLRGFIGGVFNDAAKDHAGLHYKLESIQRRCARNLDRRNAPPYPKILDITPEDYERFFVALEQDVHWRQSLALRLYFGTEVRLQPVLRARWSDIVDKTWYPFVPEERGLWQGSKQRLSTGAIQILRMIEEHHRAEGLTSPYLFPSSVNANQPIQTVQRHWKRWCDTMGWNGLPLSHVVLRHQSRLNPSYSSYFFQRLLDFDRSRSLVDVSKVAKRRENISINATTYR